MGAKSRLLEYLEVKGEKPADFYRKTGLANGYLDKHENVNSDRLATISENYRDLNLIWVVTGKGDMLIKSSFTVASEQPGQYQVQRQGSQGQSQAIGKAGVHVVVEDKEGNQLITLVSERAAAGWAAGFTDVKFYEDLPYFSVPRHLLRPGGEYFIIETFGNSMSPALHDRDLLLVRRLVNKYELRSGMVGVVLTNDGVQVKRFEPLPLGQLRLHADNPRFQPQTVEVGDCIALFHVERRWTSELDNPLDNFHSFFDSFQQRLTRLENVPQNQSLSS